MKDAPRHDEHQAMAKRKGECINHGGVAWLRNCESGNNRERLTRR